MLHVSSNFAQSLAGPSTLRQCGAAARRGQAAHVFDGEMMIRAAAGAFLKAEIWSCRFDLANSRTKVLLKHLIL